MGATTGGFGTRSAYDSGGYIPQKSTYKLGTLKQLPSNTPAVESLADIYRLRSFLLHWMGPRSFILRCAPAEQALQKPSVRKVHEEKWRRFEEEHSSASMDNMQTVLSATRTIQIGRLKKNILMSDLLFLSSCLHVLYRQLGRQRNAKSCKSRNLVRERECDGHGFVMEFSSDVFRAPSFAFPHMLSIQ